MTEISAFGKHGKSDQADAVQHAKASQVLDKLSYGYDVVDWYEENIVRVTSRLFGLSFLCVAAITSVTHAQVVLTSDQAGNTVEGKFTANQVLPVSFALSAQGETGVFGVDFAIDCGDSPMSIRSAAFDPAWPNTVGEQDFALPGPGAEKGTSLILPPAGPDQSRGSPLERHGQDGSIG